VIGAAAAVGHNQAGERFRRRGGQAAARKVQRFEVGGAGDQRRHQPHARVAEVAVGKVEGPEYARARRPTSGREGVDERVPAVGARERNRVQFEHTQGAEPRIANMPPDGAE